jgi:hypothetical protein
MRILVVLAALAVSSTAAHADTPPLSPGRIALEVAAGGVTSLAGGFTVGYLGFESREVIGCHDCAYSRRNWGAMIGLIGGAPVGVYLVGRTSEVSGSLAVSFLGAFAGGAYGIISIARDDGLGVPILALAGPTVGAVIGFNATLRYRSNRGPERIVPTVNVAPGRSMFGFAGTF